jgi:hypothetical protein
MMIRDSQDHEPHVVVTLEHAQDGEGWPPVPEERVWVEVVQEQDAAVVLSPPLFALGIALGDVVETFEREGLLFAKRVISEGTHSCVRVLARRATPEESVELLLHQIEEGGVLIWGSSYERLWALDIPDSANLAGISSLLHSLTANGFEVDTVGGILTPALRQALNR